MHQVRRYCEGDGVSVYIHKSVNFKIRNDLNVNNKDRVSLSVEIWSDKERNALVNVLYRPPNGQIEPFKNFLRLAFSIARNSNKAVLYCR